MVQCHTILPLHSNLNHTLYSSSQTTPHILPTSTSYRVYISWVFGKNYAKIQQYCGSWWPGDLCLQVSSNSNIALAGQCTSLSLGGDFSNLNHWIYEINKIKKKMKKIIELLWHQGLALLTLSWDKNMDSNHDFQMQLLIGCQQSCQPIRGHIRKSRLVNHDFILG